MNGKNTTLSQDEFFMKLALREAQQGDFPFGAVIEKNGEILSAGHNQGIKLNDPTAHAEMIDRKSTRLNSSHIPLSRMPSSA